RTRIDTAHCCPGQHKWLQQRTFRLAGRAIRREERGLVAVSRRAAPMCDLHRQASAVRTEIENALHDDLVGSAGSCSLELLEPTLDPGALRDSCQGLRCLLILG